MASKMLSRAAIIAAILYAGLSFILIAIAAGAENRQIFLQVVGQDGQPLSRARVYQYYAMHYNQQHGKEYICDINGWVELDEKKLFKSDQNSQSIWLYGLYDGKLAGFEDVNTDDLNKEIQMQLSPACRLFGTVQSTELYNLGQELELTDVFICSDHVKLLACLNKKAEFEFLLPAGIYNLNLSGKKISTEYEDIVIEAGKKEMELNYDVPADRLARLIGKEAPELTQIKGWINSEQVKLSDLRGKVILLDFFKTCCHVAAGPMPKLAELHKKYHDKGLVIIAVHPDSIVNSVEQMQEKTGKLSQCCWNDIELPFAVALDGGGSCVIEGTKQTTMGATTAAYGIHQWPTMLLIDKQGKIVREYNCDGDTEIIEKLLSAK
jgi:glutathione peroxidase-family protein